jgi:branched-chain amino acid transport system substrate-binding protein
VAALCVLGLPTGGAAQRPPPLSRAHIVDVYSSLPLQGPATAQTLPMVSGIKLALSQADGSAGPWTIHYRSLDDASAAAGGWDPAQCAANARRAASDPRAVYYIGEFNSGCSEVSIPILNQAGIPQVSPDNTYVGLTTSDPGSAPGEPSKFYPTGARTFLRLSARDTVQAAALLSTMHTDRCRKVAIAEDQEAYGAGLAALLRRQARRYKVHVVSSSAIDPSARQYRSYARKLGRERADCFMFAGIVSNNAARVTSAVANAIPKAKLYGGDAICTITFTDPARGGISASLGRRLECTSPTLPLRAYAGGRSFLAAYKAAYGASDPDPYSIYGYEAMKLGLDTITRLGSDGNRRSALLAALFATKHRHSVLGTYGFDRNGDTTLRAYGLYRVHGRRGSLAFVRNVKPH